MQNLEQSQDAHIATDHSVTKEHAIEIQRLVYKSKIKNIKYEDYFNIVGIECNYELFKKFKKRLCQRVCTNKLANNEILLFFKDFFTDAEMDILLKFAKPPYVSSNNCVSDTKLSEISKEDIRRIKKIKRKLLYQKLYYKGL